MFYLLSCALVWGATIAPLILFGTLLLERRQAARRLAKLDADAPYETRRRAEHEARLGRTLETRRFEWYDLASPRAIVPGVLAVLLALTPPLIAGLSDVGLLIGVVGAVLWWSGLRRAGVRNAGVYASLVWCVPAIVWMAVMLVASDSSFVSGYTPWHYNDWNRVFPSTVAPLLVLAWSFVLLLLAVYLAIRIESNLVVYALVASAVVPQAIVVLGGSIFASAQAALAVGLIGYVMSKARRRQCDAARARAKVDASAPDSIESVLNRGDIPLGAALVMAVVIMANVLQVFADTSITGSDWPLRVALLMGIGTVSILAFLRHGWRESIARGAIVTFAVIFALSFQTAGSWLLTELVWTGSLSDALIFPGIIYAQVGMLASVGLLLLAWSAARRRLTEYAAMGIGFTWPLIMAGMLDAQFSVLHWLPITLSAIPVVAAMWVVSGRESLGELEGKVAQS